jgi:hypothetical protein
VAHVWHKADAINDPKIAVETWHDPCKRVGRHHRARNSEVWSETITKCSEGRFVRPAGFATATAMGVAKEVR